MTKPFTSRFPDIETLMGAEPSALGAELVMEMQARDPDQAFHAGNFCHDVGYKYDQQVPSADVQLIVAEAFSWAEATLLITRDFRQGTGDYVRLTRRGATFTREQIEIAQLRTILPTYMLHDDVRAVSLPIFDAGRYEAAVLEAFKRLEVRVREAARADPYAHGAKLISDAFNATGGPLQDPEAPYPEREALRNLMAGAYGLMRNPSGHRDVGLDDPKEAAEMLVVASHLLRLVDRRAGRVEEDERKSAYQDKYG